MTKKFYVAEAMLKVLRECDITHCHKCVLNTLCDGIPFNV
ncbi:unnamed protein product, partial [marine sediment metagenome]